MLEAASVETAAVEVAARFMHIRFATEDSVLSAPKISAQGGLTIAYDVDCKNKVVHAAIAICSEKDNFCYQTAQAKAAGRLDSLLHRKEMARVNRGTSDQERHPDFFATWNLDEELPSNMETEAKQLMMRFVEEMPQFVDRSLVSISTRNGTKDTRRSWILVKD